MTQALGSKILQLAVIGAFLMGFPLTAIAAVSPSQVLVLYNADWTGDEAGTEKGQDSKEIADYYVRMHTDAATGEKPHILGLNCKHGVRLFQEKHHLNEQHLAEKSNDNKAGVERVKGRRFFSKISDDRLNDSRLVEFTLPGGAEKWQLATLEMDIEPAEGDSVSLVRAGIALNISSVAVNRGKDWTIRANVRNIRSGDLTVRVTCKNLDGKVMQWHEEYVDGAAVGCSRTGTDGIRDDQHYLDDVEQPLKAFLEDPKNARSDGTLLKDHILFIVVSYGLPRTSNAKYGIARGISNNSNNFGSFIDFGQRLQLLYYDEEKVMGFNPKPYHFKAAGPFTSYYLRAPQAWPLFGPSANPYLHPQVYEKNKGDLAALKEPLAFTASNRGKAPKEKLIYFSMRLDGSSAAQAKALIDKSVYVARHGLPRVVDKKPVPKELSESKVATFLWKNGYRNLYLPKGRGGHRLHFGSIESNGKRSFLPGSIACQVISHNAMDAKQSEVYSFLNQGVAVTAAAARYFKGAPHIHDKSWWDDEILFPLLIQGRSVAEALLANQTHLGWVTSFVGDPLFEAK